LWFCWSHLSHWAWNKGYHRCSSVCFIRWPTPPNWQRGQVKNETLLQKRWFPAGAHEFTPDFSGARVALNLVFYVVSCWSLFVLFLLIIVLCVLPRFTDSDYLPLVSRDFSEIKSIASYSLSVRFEIDKFQLRTKKSWFPLLIYWWN
jgi:hypothetical protein